MHDLAGKRLRPSPSIEVRTLGDGTRLMKQLARVEYLALGREQQFIFDRFDGQRTVEEILHGLLVEGAGPNIRGFYDLVLSCLTKGFLVEGSPEPNGTPVPKAPQSRRGFAGTIAFSMLTIAAGGAALLDAGFSPRHELRYWFEVLLFVSLGLSLSAALAGSALTRFGRHVYNARVRWDRLAPFFTLDTRDAFMGGRECEIAVALRALSAPFLVAIVSWLVESEAGMLAGGLTGLILGSPFGSTPAHQLLHALFRKQYELPRCAEKFLNHKLVLQLFNWKEKLVEEKYLLTYSTYAICWVGIVFQFASFMVESHGRLLVRGLSQGLEMAQHSVLLVNIALLSIVLAATLVFLGWLVARGFYRWLAPSLFPVEGSVVRRQTRSARPAEERIADFLAGNVLFSQLAPDVLRQVAQAMKYVEVGPGETIVRERDAGDAMFVVFSGQVEVLKEDEAGQVNRLALLGSGDLFGEIALLDQVPRTSSVRSVGAAKLLALAKQDFEPLLVRTLGAEKIKEAVQVCAFLRRNPLFADWHPQALLSLAQRFQFQQFAPGQIVIEQDRPNDSFYLVYEGQFDVRKNGMSCASLEPGNFCGEISLLRDTPATAEVIAGRGGRCLRLGKEDFLRFVSRDFLAGLAIESALETRLEGGPA